MMPPTADHAVVKSEDGPRHGGSTSELSGRPQARGATTARAPATVIVARRLS